MALQVFNPLAIEMEETAGNEVQPTHQRSVTAVADRRLEVQVHNKELHYSLRLREFFIVHTFETNDGVEILVYRTAEIMERIWIPFQIPHGEDPDGIEYDRNGGPSDFEDGCFPNNLIGICCDNPRERLMENCCGNTRIALPTENLREFYHKGLQLMRGHLFPLFSCIGSELVALLFIIYAVINLALSLRTFILVCPDDCNNTQYDNTTLSMVEIRSGSPIELTRFIIAVVSTFFALSNAIVSMRHCYTARHLYQLLLCKCKQAMINIEDNHLTNCEDETKSKDCWEGFKKFWLKYVNDLLRLIVIEALIYPALICNMLENAGHRTYKGTASEKFKFVRFIYSCASNILSVYVLRLIVLGSTVYNLEKLRRKNSSDVSGRHAQKGLVLEIFFLLHVFGQMLSQAFMIVAIWSKIDCENPERIEDDMYFISPFTWTMIALGFVLPIVGTLSFFIPVYYWAQEFPVEFMICFLRGLKKTDLPKVPEKGRTDAINIYNMMSRVEQAAEDLLKRPFYKKALYPFINPMLVSLALVYDILLLSFAAMYIFGQYETPPVTDNGSYPVANLQLCILEFNITTSNRYSYNSRYSSTYTESYSTLIPTQWFIFAAVGACIVNVANIMVLTIGLCWLAFFALLIFIFSMIDFIPGLLCLVAIVMCYGGQYKIGFLVLCVVLIPFSLPVFAIMGCFLCLHVKKRLYY